MKLLIVSLGVLGLATAALAQGSPVSPPANAPGQSSNQGSPAQANSGPGATGTVATEGTGAGTISNNAAGAGNAAMPERANPTVGSTR